jgi:toxin ParE1/3/4
MTARSVFWTHTAAEDLASALDHIATENPKAAADVLARLRNRAQTLSALSTRGRIVPELRDIGVLQYRELIERPWRIVYRIDQNRVFVIALLDARRDLGALLLERLVRA